MISRWQGLGDTGLECYLRRVPKAKSCFVTYKFNVKYLHSHTFTHFYFEDDSIYRRLTCTVHVKKPNDRKTTTFSIYYSRPSDFPIKTSNNEITRPKKKSNKHSLFAACRRFFRRKYNNMQKKYVDFVSQNLFP